MAFQQGLSGLNGAAQSLDVIGNNIANASTVGFKSSRNEFADIYATSLFGMNSTNIGIGAKQAAVTQQFNQGSISTSSSPLDLAISGEGFFQLNQNGLTTYTRNGQFKMDNNGFIVDSSGRNLTGNLADATGTIVGGPAVPLSVSLGVVPPNQTTAANITANLNYTAGVPPGAVFGAAFNAVDPITGDPVTQINPSTPSTYNYSTTVNVFDPAGTAMGLSLYFQKAGTGQWNVVGYIGGTRVLPQAADTDPITLSFDTSGRLAAIGRTGVNGTTNAANLQTEIDAATLAGATLAEVYRVIDTAVEVQVAGNKVTPEQLASAAAAYQSAVGAVGIGNAVVIDDLVTAAQAAKNSLAINVPIPNAVPADSWDFNLDLTKLTQYGSTSGVSFVSQDGYAAGQFSNLSVDKTGLIQGTYTNGRTLSLGQVHLTSFLNPNGLQSLGDNQWAETAAAGRQNSDAPGNGVLGFLQSGAVEESNVDLTAELVKLIVAQRMYQANAQTISAQSTVLQTLVNLR